MSHDEMIAAREMVEWKVRVDREFYERIQECAEWWDVEGGVSGVFRRAMRRHMRRIVERHFVAVNAYVEPATRTGSTVMTVFLPRDMADVVVHFERPHMLGIVWQFMDDTERCRTRKAFDREVEREETMIRQQKRNLQRMMTQAMAFEGEV